MTRFTTDVDGMADMAGYGMMVLLFGGGLFAFIIPTMFFISWQFNLDFLYSHDLPRRLYLFFE